MWIRTSRLSIKKSLSLSLENDLIVRELEEEGRGILEPVQPLRLQFVGYLFQEVHRVIAFWRTNVNKTCELGTRKTDTARFWP